MKCSGERQENRVKLSGERQETRMILAPVNPASGLSALRCFIHRIGVFMLYFIDIIV